MTDIEHRREFESELLDGEELLWTGKPDPTVHFSRIDALLIPFSVLWCLPAVSIFWSLIPDLGSISVISAIPLVFMGAFSLTFLLCGFYFLFGRFIYKAWRKRHTSYALTSKRALVRLAAAGESWRSVFLDAIPALDIDIRQNGVGSVKFGNSAPIASMLCNTGMDFFGSAYGAPELAFYDLRDANRVYDLALRLRTSLSG